MRALLCLALSACAVEPEVQEEALTQPPQFTPPTAPPPQLFQQVCFLDGVHDLLSNGPPGTKIPNHPHTVAVDNNGGPGVFGGAEAACLTVLRSSVHYVGLGYEKGTLYGGNFYDGNANTHCFLQSIQGSGMDPGSVALVRNGNTWSVAISNGNNPIPSAAGAVCFDYQPSSWWTFSFNATTDLRDSYPSGPVVPSYQVACGLTALAGDFHLDNPNSEGWMDTQSNWYLTFDIVGPVSASLECLR